MRDKHYQVWTVRLAMELRDWLKTERQKYESWNKFFVELRRRYEKM